MPASRPRRAKLLALASAFLITASVLVAPTAATAAGPAKTALSIKTIAPVSGSSVVSGELIKITGTSTRNLTGRTLVAQVKEGSGWRTLLASPKVSSTGAFSFTTKAIGVGATTYRVVFTATKTLSGATASKGTTVWKWFYLSDQKTVESKEYFGWYAPSAKPATVKGKDYASAIVGRSKNNLPSYSEFNLSYQCKSFVALAGVDDSSPTASSGTSWVSVDGTTAASSQVTLALGKTKTVTVNVADSMRLRLSVLSANKEAVPAVWANARILCQKNVNPKS